MSNLFPDEEIRIRWIATFKDEAKGMTGWYRRATSEFKKASAEQVRSEGAATKAARESATAFRQNQQDKIRDAEQALLKLRRLHKDEARLRRTNNQDALESLAELRAAFKDIDTRQLLGSRTVAQAQREVRKIIKEQTRDIREADVNARLFVRHVQQMREEAVTTGRVTEDTFSKVTNSFRLSGQNASVFKDEMRRAGLEVRRFGKDGRVGVQILQDHERQLGRSRREMSRASDVLRGFGGWFRFSTNEMILFNQTLRTLRIPVFVGAIAIAAQAVGTLAGGLVALVSALAPLSGLLAGIGPVALGAAQAFVVWKIATDNLGKSANNLSKVISTSLTGSTKDFRKLLSQLPPAAREFAKELRSIAPGFQKFREQLSQPIFRGLTDGLRALKPAFAGLRPILVDTATIIGDTFRQLGQEIGGADWARDIQTQAANTNRWMVTLQPSVLALARAFRDLSIAAAPVVTHVVDGIARGAQAISKWVNQARGSGRLAGFFKETNYVLDRTLSILGRFGKALINIGKIAYQTIGRQMLRDIDNAAGAFQEWTESKSGIRAIRKYFVDLKAPLYEMGRLAVQVAKSFVTISRSGGFEQTLVTIRTKLLPALEDLFDSVQGGFVPAMISALSSMIELMTTLTSSSGGLTQIARVFGGIADVLNTLLNTIPGLKTVFLGLLTAMITFRAIKFVGAITGLTLFSRILAKAVTDMQRLNRESLRANRLFNTITLGGVRPQAARVAMVGGRPAGRPRFGSTPVGERAGVGVGPGVVGGVRGIFSDRTRLGRVGAGVGFGAVGAAALFGESLLPGRAGAALQSIGGGALTGLAVGGPWGALVGGIAGAAFAFKDLVRSSNGLSQAAKRAASALEQIRSARLALPGARLDVAQARLDVRRTSRELRQGRIDFGLGRITSDDLKQLQINAARARDTLKQARIEREKLNAANRQGLTAFRQTQRQFRDELAGIPGILNLDKGAKPTRADLAFVQLKLRDFAKNAEKASLPGLARVAKQIETIIKTTGKLPSKKQIQILIKTRFDKPDTAAIPPAIQAILFPGMKNLFPGAIPGTGLLPPQGGNAGTRTFAGGEVSPRGLAGPTTTTRRGGGRRGPAPFALPNLAGLSAAQLFGSGFGTGFGAGTAGGMGTNFISALNTAITDKLPRDVASQVFGAVSGALSGGALASLQTSLTARAKGLMAQVAAHPGKEKLKDQLDAIVSALDTVQQAIGQAVGAMVFEANQAAARITRRADALERRGERANIDPDAPGGVQLAQQINRIRIQAAKTTQAGLRKALVAARAAGAAPEDIESIRQDFLAAQDETAKLLTDGAVNAFKLIRARRQVKLDKASFRESMADIALTNLESRQRISGSFDSPTAAAARATLIRKQADAALHTENVLRETLKRSKQQHLTMKERQDLQLQIAQKHSEYLSLIAQATEETAQNTIPKIQGQLAFGFGNQITTDAIASSVGA